MSKKSPRAPTSWWKARDTPVSGKLRTRDQNDLFLALDYDPDIPDPKSPKSMRLSFVCLLFQSYCAIYNVLFNYYLKTPDRWGASKFHGFDCRSDSFYSIDQGGTLKGQFKEAMNSRLIIVPYVCANNTQLRPSLQQIIKLQQCTLLQELILET